MDSVGTGQKTLAKGYQINKDRASKFALPGSEVMISGRPWIVDSGCVRLCDMCESGIRERVVCDDIAHGLCQACDQQLTTRTCIFCYKKEGSIEAEVRQLHNKSLSRMADECIYQCTEEGCTWKSQYSDIARHISSCATHIYQCRFKDYGCKERDTKEELSLHEINCMFRETVCSACHQRYCIRPETTKAHADSCRIRKRPCVISLSQDDWQHLSALAQWAKLDLKTQQAELMAGKTPLPQAQGAELAAAVNNRKPINGVCEYHCGAILDHPDEFPEHYQNDCPNRLVSCEGCGFGCLRWELAEHYKRCQKAVIECPSGCGVSGIREHIEGEHNLFCAKQIVKCPFCTQTGERGEIKKNHEPKCYPTPCQYCGHPVRLPEQKTHRESCPDIQPFELAGYRYIRQASSNALIFQRADELLVTHVCIPTTNTALVSWLNGNPNALEYYLRVKEQASFYFQLAKNSYICHFSRHAELRSSSHRESSVTLCCLDGKGNKLGTIYTNKRADTCLYAFNPSDTYQHVVDRGLKQTLESYPVNTKAFLVISLLPHQTLFPSQPETKGK